MPVGVGQWEMSWDSVLGQPEQPKNSLITSAPSTLLTYKVIDQIKTDVVLTSGQFPSQPAFRVCVT